MKFFRYLLFTLLVIFSSNNFAQNLYNYETGRDTFKVGFETEFQLSEIIILSKSVKVFENSELIPQSQYSFDSTTNRIQFDLDFAPSIGDTLVAEYLFQNLDLRKVYSKRELIKINSLEVEDTVYAIKSNSEELDSKSIFGNDIQKSGTILRGFTVGTNKDFTLNSGLRLQLSGKLSDDLEITAALTDENTPIQPEGNTERLEELDKVFIEVKHPIAQGIFGDYEYNLSNGEFGRIKRKLQGLTGKLTLEKTEASFAIAGSRGKFNTNEFTGVDGVQGPYRLSGINNERNIIIIAGSEKVFLDGKEMKRGENNDYIIEYANGELTFTTNRLITSVSRIIIDFEYTDQRYNRNFIGADFSSQFLNDKIKLDISLMREGDDQDSPIDFILTDNEINILSEAGDDRNGASLDGAVIAPLDSLGNRKGAYIKIDSLVDGISKTIYTYSPGDLQAIYNVTFSYVGEQNGDYRKENLGHYKFVGVGEGAYLPIRFLPMPELTQTANVVLQYRPTENLAFELELAGSDNDKNRFSDLDESDNNGLAYNLSLSLRDYELKSKDNEYGKLSLIYRDRFIRKDYTSLYRINEIEFDRLYNTNSAVKLDENLREAEVKYGLNNNIDVVARYGKLSKGDSFSSDRFYSDTKIYYDERLNLNYQFDYVNTQNNFLVTDWLRQSGNVNYKIGIITPGIEFSFENKEQGSSGLDSLNNQSLRYEEYSPYIGLFDLYGMRLNYKYTFRNEFFPFNGFLVKESNSRGNSFELDYSSNREFSTNFTFTQRKKEISEQFKLLGKSNNESILIRNQSSALLFDRFLRGSIFYEASTRKTSKLERVFVQVPIGTGNYIYLGDLNNNGIAEENEYEPTIFDGEFIQITIPSDELIPIVELKTNTRWNLDFAQIVNGNSFLEKIVNPLSIETFYRIEENSKELETKKIYLLNMDSFLNDSTTIRGFNQFQSDFHIFKNKRDLSFRLRYNQRKGLNQFSSGIERSYFREQSLRIRFKMIEEFSNETEIVSESDFVDAAGNSRRARRVESQSLKSDFSYKPYRNIEVGFTIENSQSEDSFPQIPTQIDANSQKIRFVYAIANTGRLQLEVERNELITNNSENYIPFQLTKGNQIGKNYFWRLNFDYRLSQNLQMSFNYDGRLLGGSNPIHTMRAEAQAFF
ncbi:MAG: hypothetical protein K9J12_14735 [Melioribacteraceae bacterium]|nr:hypothetical protein [Melioribacteraceae bacterium]